MAGQVTQTHTHTHNVIDSANQHVSDIMRKFISVPGRAVHTICFCYSVTSYGKLQQIYNTSASQWKHCAICWAAHSRLGVLFLPKPKSNTELGIFALKSLQHIQTQVSKHSVINSPHRLGSFRSNQLKQLVLDYCLFELVFWVRCVPSDNNCCWTKQIKKAVISF